MKIAIYLSIIFLIAFAGNNELMAKTEKKSLTIEDIKLWRSSYATLSDDGEWYTVQYTYRDKPETKKDTTKENSDENNIEDYYTENNQTNVLYIGSANDGIKYRIPDGRKPFFSSESDWVAYQIEPEKDEDKKEEVKTTIELKHLETGFTISYDSKARYSFPEDKDLFITQDESSILLYDLNTRQEHYIAQVGESLIDKKSNFIVYTIESKDKRGNGIYIYDPEAKTTKALTTGNYIFSGIAWNKDRTSIVAYQYKKDDKKIDYKSVNVLAIKNINTNAFDIDTVPITDFEGMPENMVPKLNGYNSINWSDDENRFIISMTKDTDNDEKEKVDKKDSPTVQVWHWKDEKLLSQKMLEYERNQKKTSNAILFLSSKTIVPLSGEELQYVRFSEDNDKWAIGEDNRKYISDWDVRKNDLYKIDLNNGNKTLITEELRESAKISPHGNKLVFWDEKDYWFYNLDTDEKSNLTDKLEISFVNTEYDMYGKKPAYGFVGWVKDQDAILVYNKFDIWLLPLGPDQEAQNLTHSASREGSIRFRFENLDSYWSSDEVDDRYIDLSKPIILSAFDIYTKNSGFYKLTNNDLQKLIFKPASFGISRWDALVRAKNSDKLLYILSDYQNDREYYLSDIEFKTSIKITNTNPQQEEFKWGKRILINYKNDDGIDLQGILSIPESYKKGQKLPMIVYTYEKLSDNLFNYPTPSIGGAGVCEMLYVSDDYLFLQPDIHFNIGTPHSDMHECIDAAITKVIELGYVDEERIGYEGFSFGGHCGMYVATQENKFAAIAAGAGVSNLIQGFSIDIVADGSNEQDYYMTGQGRLGTDPASNTEMFTRESPVLHAANMNTPLLLFHGTDDKVVQWEHSFGYYNLLRYLNKPVVFLSYKGESHGLRKLENRIDIQTRLKEYFDYYLKGKEAPEWAVEELEYVPEKSGKDDKSNNKPGWK